MLDSIFGQSKVYKSFCQWYVLALNKGLAIWKRNCTQNRFPAGGYCELTAHAI